LKRLRIGLCYDLKSDYLAAGFPPEDVMEFDEEETIQSLAGALEELGHEAERVGRGLELARRLAAGERWDLVFNVAEGVRGRSREAQVPALCELFDQPYTFSDPLTCAVTLDKPMTKRLVRDGGIATPSFAVVERPEQADDLNLEFPLFVKPAAEGSSKGVTGRSRVSSRDELREACAELIHTFRQPVLIESYLPGREITVGIVGNDGDASVVGAMEVTFNHGTDGDYTAINKQDFENRVTYRLVDGPLGVKVREMALSTFHLLSCRDVARVDFRCDAAGEPCFLEVNPLPGLHPTYSDLPIMSTLAGISYTDLLGRIVDASGRRWGLWT
jgi:D-alanine-D-alanine ligase